MCICSRTKNGFIKKGSRDVRTERAFHLFHPIVPVRGPSPAFLGTESGSLGEMRFTQGTLSIYSL